MEKSRQLEEYYRDRNLPLDSYRTIYKKETGDEDETSIRQSYNRYKSRTIAKSSVNLTITSAIPNDVSRIILSKTSKIKPYNRSSYYDKSRLPEVEKKCERAVTLRELKDLVSESTVDKKLRQLLQNNTFVVAPIRKWQETRIFTFDGKNITSEEEINNDSLNNSGYNYLLLTIDNATELSLQQFIKKEDRFGYAGSIITLPFYRYILERRTLCFNLVDEQYVNNQLMKIVRSNINNLIGEISKIFPINYDIILNLNYKNYYITKEIAEEALNQYNDTLSKRISLISFLSNIMKSLTTLILFYYAIGILDISEREETKIGIITEINDMTGTVTELINLINLHLYIIIFGLRSAIDMRLYETEKLGNGLVSLEELKEGFFEYIGDK